MRITCIIDTLVGGGAQRQLCTLAVQFKRMGHIVEVLTYHEGDFFRPMLDEAGIAHRILPIAHDAGKLKRILEVRKAIHASKPDVVLAFLDGPCMYASLAGLPSRRWGLVVSERLAVPGSHKRRFQPLRQVHRLANYVTANSHINRLMVEAAVPALSGRTVTVYNVVDLERFRPRPQPDPGGPIRISVLAHYHAKKNMQGLIEGLALARQHEEGKRIEIEWYGSKKPPEKVYDDAQALIEKHGMQNVFRLNPSTKDAEGVYARSTAACLPSFYEGLPNAVCEAMASGKPVLMSAACDAGALVHDGQNGFLFDPASPQSIADALLKLARLTPAEREEMGRESRRLAEQMFDPFQVATKYIEILEAAANRKRKPIGHWPTEVPKTAVLD